MAWIFVGRDIKRQDQCTSQFDPKSGAITEIILETWIANCDDKTTTCYSALTASFTVGMTTVAIPTRGASYSFGSNAFVCSQCVPQREGPTTFAIQVQYTRNIAPTPPEGGTIWNVSIDFDGAETQQTAYKDKDDAPILAGNGAFYSPSLQETINDEVINISYQTTTEQSASLDSIRGLVNSGDVSFTLAGVSRSFSARQLLCKSAKQSGSFPLGDATPVWTITATFINRADTWQDSVLEQGTFELVDGQKLQILDEYGEPITTPVQLNSSGAINTGSPVYTVYKIQKEADFTSYFLGLA